MSKIERMERVEEPEINRKIVLGFIEKLEKFTPKEREVLLRIIELLSRPIFISNL